MKADTSVEEQGLAVSGGLREAPSQKPESAAEANKEMWIIQVTPQVQSRRGCTEQDGGLGQTWVAE